MSDKGTMILMAVGIVVFAALTGLATWAGYTVVAMEMALVCLVCGWGFGTFYAYHRNDR